MCFKAWRLLTRESEIVLRALEEPLRQIVANAGVEPSVVVNKVAEGKGNYGFNTANDTYGDMVEMGVLDPTKVTRYALQNAASAGFFIPLRELLAEQMPCKTPYADCRQDFRNDGP